MAGWQGRAGQGQGQSRAGQGRAGQTVQTPARQTAIAPTARSHDYRLEQLPSTASTTTTTTDQLNDSVGSQQYHIATAKLPGPSLLLVFAIFHNTSRLRATASALTHGTAHGIAIDPGRPQGYRTASNQLCKLAKETRILAHNPSRRSTLCSTLMRALRGAATRRLRRPRKPFAVTDNESRRLSAIAVRHSSALSTNDP